MRIPEYEPRGENHVVSTDLHGDSELTKLFLDFAARRDAIPVSAGDTIGRRGSDPRKTIRLLESMGVAQLGGTITLGNHEWDFLNAISSLETNDSHATVRAIGSKAIRTVIETGESYGLKYLGDLSVFGKSLRVCMGDDLTAIENRPGYYETEDIIVTHAGPKASIPWKSQRDEIDKKIQKRRESGKPTLGPLQIMDPKHHLSGPRPVSKKVSRKIFVTGHKHSDLSPEKRIANRRIYLACQKDVLHVFETATGAIHTLTKNPKKQIIVPSE